MKPVRLLLGLGLAVGLSAGPSWGYEEVPVSDGGTLQGMVTLIGKVPKPKGYNLVTLPDAVYCGRISTGTGWRLLQPFVVGPNGGFKNVVIYIEELRKGKPFNYDPPTDFGSRLQVRAVHHHRPGQARHRSGERGPGVS